MNWNVRGRVQIFEHALLILGRNRDHSQVLPGKKLCHTGEILSGPFFRIKRRGGMKKSHLSDFGELRSRFLVKLIFQRADGRRCDREATFWPVIDGYASES